MSKRKKIFIDVFYLQSALTGIRSYTLELVNELKKYSSHYDIVVYPNFHKMRNKQLYLKNPGFIRRAYFHWIYFLWKQVRLPVLVKREGAEILICPDFVLPIWKLKGVLKMAVIHDSLFWKYPQNYNEIWREYYTKSIRLGLSGHSHIVTTSGYARMSLIPLFPKSEIHVVYQKHRTLPKSQADPLSEFDLESGMYFFHLGFFDPRKNLMILLRAFCRIHKKYPEFKLVLAGKNHFGSNHHVVDEIKLYLQQEQLVNHVVLTGYLKETELSDLYRHAIAYVFPSLDEGFGIPILESFANKTPVIVSDAGALKEIGGDGVLTFKVHESEDLAEKMVKIIENEALRRELITNGERRLKDFAEGEFGKSYITLIEKILT